MLAESRHFTRARRGIVLVLVLAMLGLLALIGVTFATFSGQARINSRNFAQSVIQPQDDELMDFALSQLITDTGDVRSAIRGHSLARDMFGNDAFNNGYLATNPVTGGVMQITSMQASSSVAGTYDVLTNLPVPAASAAMFGYNFTRWVMRVSYISTVTAGNPVPVSQTCEILVDDFLPGANNTAFSGQGYHAFRVSPIDTSQLPNVQTVLNNPTLGWTITNTNNPFPGWTSNNPAQLALTQAFNAGTFANVAFTLDGRWLHAFNGPGMGATSSAVNISYGNYNNVSLSVPNSTYGNFRYNGIGLNSPTTPAMDEDYDACDLENWFLAIQSADGQVMIPSFHRPGVVRYQDPANLMDWDPVFRANYWRDSASRILRPVAADGHDSATFPNLVPDPNTGKITYDVDNDGDGVTDSVWVDLGYPARRDSRGILYKPLFAFMVIGLNGRIPLNTAGNLAGAGATHTQHLGNSVSEIDPTYALQNAYVQPGTSVVHADYDPFNQLLGGTLVGGNGVYAGPSSTSSTYTNTTYNTQVDNAYNAVVNSSTQNSYQSVDVRLTQLRNILSGTRPQVNPFSPDTTGTINGDLNVVWGSWPGLAPGTGYTLPNGVADGPDVAQSSYSVSTTQNGQQVTLTNPLVQRMGPPVGGRWGEATSVAGVPFPNPSPNGNGPLNMVQPNYVNPPRGGYSFDVADFANAVVTGNVTYDANGDPLFPRDAADDNFNAFDVFPPRLSGEIGDLDWYDSAGALILPVERMRRFVTPVDINGSGRVQTWGAGNHDYGPDNFGRVQFNSYFRPAGVAGPINIDATTGTYPYGAIAPPAVGGYGSWSSTGTVTPWTSGETYIPDVTNNPLHGYEFFKIPNTNQVAGVTTTVPSYNGVNTGGMPVAPPGNPPTTFPTYNNQINSSQRLDGVNEADEMNLYVPNPLLDSPYGPSDLEWLYRQQDVDGATLTSRLSQLAPVSFTNTLDGQRRRRLFALDTFETNNFVWTTDNPQGAFGNNARFTALQNASTAVLSTNVYGNAYVVPTPSLAHRDKKINLNYPLPVSNDPNEPIRQKWIYDAYQMLKMILPPTSVDSPEELAQLSQFVINVIDFRDPDATMTHWRNPDVVINPGTVTTAGGGTAVSYYYANPTLVAAGSTLVTTASIPLDQYGMEYNPVAINEVLAYGFQSRTGTTVGTATYTNRLFVELVNTLTAAYNPTFDITGNATTIYNNYYGYGPVPGGTATTTTPTGGNIADATTPPYQASTLDLGGFAYTAGDPYSGGCWDLVFTTDNPMARPDPYRGDLLYNTNAVTAGQFTMFGLIPLNRDSFPNGSNPTSPNGGDVTLLPLSPTASTVVGGGNPGSGPFNPPTNQPAPPAPPVNYFYVIGSPANTSTNNGTTSQYEYNPIGTTGGSTTQYPCMTQVLMPAFDPMNSKVTPPTIQWYPGILPGITTVGQQPPNYQWRLPSFGGIGNGSVSPPTSGTALYYWVCLRRPANPFAPVSATNPMCVVDSMRFPYIDGTINAGKTWTNVNGIAPPVTPGSGPGNTIFSAQRLQPYRGGHAVPLPNAPAPSLTSTTTTMPPDPRYGYTEQIAIPYGYTQSGGTGTYGLANMSNTSATIPSTNVFYHTLGYNNDSAENWDYLVFNDRDFSSVAELMLVPGCPPGLFTKQFVEFAPSLMNAVDIFGQVTPVIAPQFTANLVNSGAAGPLTTRAASPLTPFATGTVPFLDVSQATVNSVLGSSPPSGSTLPSSVPAFGTTGNNGLTYPYAQPTGSINSPVQPHAFPYLVDKFFYTGASTFYYPPTGAALDPGSSGNAASSVPTAVAPVVGGPGGDGWFKMFEFFEVPSQAMGAIGPVASGANFDWARQDTKPGLMNLNLIIDEEAFFSIFGRQSTTGFNQSLLNSVELPLLSVLNNNGQLVLPYAMPLATLNNGNPPIPLGGPPVPLVVTAIQPSGGPNYAYPITDQTQYVTHGYLANDPIWTALNTASTGAGGNPIFYPANGNRIKAAFAQFLWSRHGGSGYVFGFGNGSTGQNSSVATPGLTTYSLALPAERPFHSLSYPDINYTIMRPATLPPSTVSNPAMINANPASNAAALYTTQTPTAANGGTTPLYFGSTEAFYSPFVTNNATAFEGIANTPPIVYTGDPGVRNPFFNQGYVTGGALTSPYTLYTATTPYTNPPATPNFLLPAGVPIPTNVAFPPTSSTNPPVTDSIMMPPPIPPARLFQSPDYFGAHQIHSKGYVGINASDLAGSGNIPPALSNATDSGDPWINNTVANQALNPWAANTPPVSIAMYTLNHGFTSLMWAGGTFYSSAGSAVPFLSGTGVLPPTYISYPPYFQAAPAATPGRLSLNNSTTGSAPNNLHSPYLGANTGGAASNYTDDRQHPYWRSELIQKAMNLTTVRTHQYAVWITIGFFEIKRQGDIGMLAQAMAQQTPALAQAAFDTMGPEVGALNGNNVRYRGFFLIDRLQLTGFNPTAVGGFRSAVVYRKVIQ